MSHVKAFESDFGFDWGAASVTRIYDDKTGRVVIGLKTPRAELELHVLKSGKVRIFDKDCREWKAREKGTQP